MSEFYADWEKMNTVTDELDNILKDMNNSLDSAVYVRNTLDCVGKEDVQLKNAIGRCNRKLESVIYVTKKCCNIMKLVSTYYRDTEEILMEESCVYKENNTNWDFINNVNRFNYNDDEMSVAGGVWRGSANILGLGVIEGSVSGEFLKGNFDHRGNFNFENGNVGLGYGYDGKISILSGKGHSQINLFNRDDLTYKNDIEVELLNVASNGYIGGTLFKDGKLDPSLNIMLNANGSVLSGNYLNEMEIFGNKMSNYFEGDVLGFDAGIDVQNGNVKYTDMHGNIKQTEGSRLKFGAEAYVAKGRVFKGLTIMGIDLGVGISGTYAGVGASGSAMITDKCIQGEIGVDLGLGVDLDFIIDRSNFSFDKVFESVGIKH